MGINSNLFYRKKHIINNHHKIITLPSLLELLIWISLSSKGSYGKLCYVFGVKRIQWEALHNSFFLKPHEQFAALEDSKFQSVFLIYLLLHYWSLINLQMSTEWEFAFLNTAILITFCLIYTLNIPYKNQNPSLFPVDCSVSISSKLTFQWQWVVKCSHKNNFDIFFRAILPLWWETDSCLILMEHAN